MQNQLLYFVSCLQGTGRYAIYIANYASGNVGPHALIEMDESASDLSQGVIALSNVAEEAGVNKFTGECERSVWSSCSSFPTVKRGAVYDRASSQQRLHCRMQVVEFIHHF